MADDEKKSSGVLTKLLAMSGTALITFFASLVWGAYEKTAASLREMTERVHALEEDKSKWGTLTELHNKTVSMEVEMGRLQGVMQGFSMAVHGGLVEKKPLAILPPPADPKLPPADPKPEPKPIPELKNPRELFRDAEEYRKLQQQKYPAPNVQQRQ